MIKDSRNILQISYDDQTRHIFDIFILLKHISTVDSTQMMTLTCFSDRCHQRECKIFMIQIVTCVVHILRQLRESRRAIRRQIICNNKVRYIK